MNNQPMFTIDELQVIKNALRFMSVYGGYNDQTIMDAYNKAEVYQELLSEELNAKLMAKKKMYQVDLDGIPPYATK